MSVKVFWCEDTGLDWRSLRRYARGDSACPHGYHDASVLIGEFPTSREVVPAPSHDDPRWPTRCDHCAYEFAENDEWEVFVESIYEGGGQRFALRNAPPGAAWDANWHDSKPGIQNMCGPDGVRLVVVCPDGHQWMVDSRANNCTLPNDNDHYCWIRHGDPRHPETLTVDKSGGRTCAAGAGSILTPGYHGFLSNGQFT